MERPHLTHPLFIRCARQGDTAALHAACFPEQTRDWVADYLRWCLAAPGRPVRLVALMEEAVVAHVEVAPRQGGAWAELSSLVVAAPYRRLGIGRRVVGAAVRLAHRLGCGEVRLQVVAHEQGLIDMYRGWGFHPRGAPLVGRCWLALPVPFPMAPAPTPRPLLSLPLNQQHGSE